MITFLIFVAIFFSIVGGFFLGNFIECLLDALEGRAVRYNIAGIIIALIGLSSCAFLICGSVKAINKVEEQKKESIKIETRVAPQVDTTINIKDGLKDTIYVYHFKEVED